MESEVARGCTTNKIDIDVLKSCAQYNLTRSCLVEYCKAQKRVIQSFILATPEEPQLELLRMNRSLLKLVRFEELLPPGVDEIIKGYLEVTNTFIAVAKEVGKRDDPKYKQEYSKRNRKVPLYDQVSYDRMQKELNHFLMAMNKFLDGMYIRPSDEITVKNNILK